MLRELLDTGLLRPITGGEVLQSLVVAMLCGLIIAMIYRHTYRGTGYAPSFTRSMVILPMITAVVILVIGNNLARAFGLVGAMSIIRFRTAVKETHDIVFIFFSLAVGLAAGVGMFAVSWIGTFVVGLTIMATERVGFGHVRRNAVLLEFRYDATDGPTPPSYQRILDAYCRSVSVLSVRQPSDGVALDMTFHVRLKRPGDHAELVRRLGETDRVERVSVFYDDEEL